jgi:peptidoglycan/xylan/chitin deacetylase (PgdA/CDA1 family)
MSSAPVRTLSGLSAALALALALAAPRPAAAAAAPAPTPPAVRLAPTVRGVPLADKVVAFSFDDGPSPRYTPEILSLLKANRARATFFLIGQEVARYPDLVRAEAAAGMELGNHGMHHIRLRGRTEEEVAAEANEAADLLQGLVGRRPNLYRLPQGVGDTAARAALGRLGYVIVQWSVDTRDYLRQSPDALVQRAMRQMAPGRIVIFHDGGGDRSATVEAVRRLLPMLRAQGYTVTTVGDLLRRAGYRWRGQAA